MSSIVSGCQTNVWTVADDKNKALLLRIFEFHELLEFVLEVLSIFKIEN
jgi:hypothetical protein